MRLKKCVLSLLRKLVRVEMSLMSDGSAFQARGPAMILFQFRAVRISGVYVDRNSLIHHHTSQSLFKTGRCKFSIYTKILSHNL